MPKNQGFTLVEVLVAMAILAISLTAVMTMIISSFKMIQESREATESALFVSSLSSLLNVSDPDNLSAETFSGLTYNDRPVIITFSKSMPDQKLVRVNIVLEMKSGQKRTYTLYVSRK